MQNQTVYIVDDDSDDRDLLREVIEELGSYRITEFEDGRKLIDALQADDLQQVNLLFLDMNMPRMNGLETVRILRANNVFKFVPTVMFSTTSSQELIDSAHKAGIDLFFLKPNSLRELRSMTSLVLSKFL
jgi:CheY-like chemotaxis protein